MTETQLSPKSWFGRLHDRLHANPVTGLITKVVVTILGVVVILVGIVLSGPGIPGPGVVVILAGLALLATEWRWARRLLQYLRERAHRAAERARQMDPKVRRRRVALATATVVLVVAGVTLWVYLYDWPAFAVNGWNWVQDLNGVVPELPGM